MRTFEEIQETSAKRYEMTRSAGKMSILVGTATCGRSVGAMDVLEALKLEAKDYELDCTIEEVGCLGHCYAEPMVAVGNREDGYRVYGYIDKVAARTIIRDIVFGNNRAEIFYIGDLDKEGRIVSESLVARNALESRLILSGCGTVAPGNIASYIAEGGYSSLRKALEMDAEEIVCAVEGSKLRGRGGAGFPTGKKWRACKEAPSEKRYIICNADEGDPGAFIDRMLLESNPHAIIEGMIIAALGVGASEGRVYVRAEYPLAAERLRIAAVQARTLGILGSSVLGSGFSFDIKVFEAAGAFVCGEESSLLASLEGRRGIPRQRPPFPAESGFNGKPSVIDNVKTFACVRHIIGNGAEWFAQIGTPQNTGTAAFALAGTVARLGLVEVPMGTTLRQIIFEAGGGMTDPNFEKPGEEIGAAVRCMAQFKVLYKKDPYRFKAVQIGGPSGGCLPESALDLPVDFDSLEGTGAMMGSGGLVVMSDQDCMVEMARYFLEFTQQESCGKCSFCRIGTKLMLQILEKFTHGEGSEEDLDRLEELAHQIKEGSFCNLGKTAPNPVLTTIKYFRDEYEAHFKRQECPGLVCPDLISYEFAEVMCRSSCVECCIVCDAITSESGWDGYWQRATRTHEIDDELCTRCGICVDSCAGNNYNAIKKVTPAKRKKVAHG